MKRKGIILTFEGFPETIIESQVIVHAREMKELGIELELWTFDVFGKSYPASVASGERVKDQYGVCVRVFRGVRPVVPLSEFINSLLFLWKLLRLGKGIQIVRCRGEYGTVVAGIVGFLRKFELIWDCRGDTYWETRPRVCTGGLIKRSLGELYCELVAVRERLAGVLCDRAIFVSERLREVKRGQRGADRSFVIPCSAPESLFYFSSELRRTERKRLGYAESDCVFVYSGSINHYQCFEEAVSLVGKYMERDPRFRFLVLTPNTEKARQLLKGLRADRVLLVSAKFEEINGYLNAADIGMFLRKPIQLNAVASPVKFAEYSLTGLSVIMSDAVEQCVAYAKAFGTYIEYEWEGMPIVPMMAESKRLVVAEKAAQTLGRKSQRKIFERLYGQCR